ncbi:MAG: YggT family protein [Acetobacteraceae bacterium]|nr:YggT family protein [Acetobacteraceae bacterium]
MRCGRSGPPLGCAQPWRRICVIEAVFLVVSALLSLFWWAVLLAAIVSTLVSFGVLDSRNRIVWTIADFLYRVTEPVLRPIRNLLPNLGGIDISPLIVLILISVIQSVLLPKIFLALEGGGWRPVIY